jgi:alanine racemase
MGPTKAYIDHNNLRHNFNLIRDTVSPARVMGVVKADAYGHGSVECARTLLECGAGFLGVAFHEEGVELRQAGIQAPIMVFGAQLREFFRDHLINNLDITLASAQQIEPLAHVCRETGRRARIHIKVDTGMGRVGFRSDEVPQIIERILNTESLEIIGVYSHLSSADEDDLTYTKLQIARFAEVKKSIESVYPGKILYHLANSAAIMRLPEACFDMVRPGVMIYGNPPGPDFPLSWDLRQVMRFASQITSIKRMKAGEPVSYNRRYFTRQDTCIGLIPVGYADGFNRRFTNSGSVLICGKRYPVAGTVCMDQIMVDLGPDSEIQVGDEAVLYGRQGVEQISIIEVSRNLQTIPYEVTCSVTKRVPRVHLNTNRNL